MHARSRAAQSRIVIAGLAGLLLTGCGSGSKPSGESVAAPPVAVIPVPRKIENGAGVFLITENTRVEFGAGADVERVGRYFTDLVQRTYSVGLATGNSESTIRFELQAGESSTSAEGYSLSSSPSRIVVSADDSRGLFYGAVTLWQLLSKTERGWVVPAVTIEDSPRFAWRGLMLDSARHYQSLEFIRKFIDVMALHKLNVFHWHLTDDQAWRIEIKKYPRLTEVGAWRVPAGPAALADIDAATGKPRLYGGFYTQDQIREVIAYAAARNITVVPEIDMPGHASSAIAAYPQLGVVKGGVKQVPADWGVYQTIFNVDEPTMTFFEDVLAEVVELFPSEYIHIGGDEAVKDQWKHSPAVQKRMRELGVKDEHEMQSYIVKRMEKFLSAKGRRLIGWDEILEGGLAPNATVMSWRGIDGAIAAAAAGHDTVLSPFPTLYFDNRPVASPTLPGRGRVISVQDVYAFDPAPAAIDEAKRKHVLGVQANIWVEHIRTTDRVEVMTFPKAAAIAEIGWSAQNALNWDSFSGRLPAMQERYRSLNLRYAENVTPSALAPDRRTSHELTSCTDKILLSLEDDAPVSGERAVFLVDILNPCWLFKEAELSSITGLVASVGQTPFNFQIGDAIKEIPLSKTATPAGELEVRIDSCEGEVLAVLPLAPAVSNYGVTQLPAANIAPKAGKHDLCFKFTRKRVDPIWTIESIELKRAP